MHDELTMRDLENLEYRKKRLTEQARKAEVLLSGRQASLLPLIEKDGAHDEAGTQALIRDLMEELDLYLRFRRAGQQQSIDNSPLKDLPSDLTKEERETFESFLYCALRLCAGRYDWIVEADGTFDDLLDLAKEFHYTTAEGLFIDELIALPEGLWGALDILYSGLTGTDPSALITQEEKDAMDEQYQRSLAAYNAYLDEIAQQLAQEDPEVLQDYWEQQHASMTEEELRQEEELDRFNEELVRRQEEAVARFPEKEVFLFHYMRLRKTAFLPQAHVSMLAKWLEYVIDIYLYRQGKSSFLTDESYFPAHRLLERTAKELQGLFRDKR